MTSNASWPPFSESATRDYSLWTQNKDSYSTGVSTELYVDQPVVVPSADFLVASEPYTTIMSIQPDGPGSAKFRIKMKVKYTNVLSVDWITSVHVFFQYSISDIGTQPPELSPEQLSGYIWSFNPVRAVKLLGKTLVLNTGRPPNYAVVVMQQIAITAIDRIPEFEVFVHFDWNFPKPERHEVIDGGQIIRGSFGFFTEFTQMRRDPTFDWEVL